MTTRQDGGDDPRYQGPGGTLAYLRDIRDAARHIAVQYNADWADKEVQKYDYRSLADVERRINLLERTQGANATREAQQRMSRELQHGATWGFDDDLANLIPGGETTQSLREQLHQDQAQHPYMTGAQNLTGGLLTAYLTRGLLPKMAGAGLVAKSLLGAVAGGLEGGTAGIGYSEEPTMLGTPATPTQPARPGRLQQAKWPAVIGAGIGAISPSLEALAAPYLARAFSSPSQVARRAVTALPAAEVEQMPAELAALRGSMGGPAVRPGPRVMDTRGGQRVAERVAEVDPQGAGQILADIAKGRETPVVTGLQRLLGRPAGPRVQLAAEFLGADDISGFQKWLGNAPPQAAQQWRDGVVRHLAEQLDQAPDKVAYLQSIAPEKLRLVLPREDVNVLQDGLRAAARMRETEAGITTALQAGNRREAQRIARGMGFDVADFEAGGDIKSRLLAQLFPARHGGRTIAGARKLADYLTQETVAAGSPFQPRPAWVPDAAGMLARTPRTAAAGVLVPQGFDLYRQQQAQAGGLLGN